MSIDGIHPSQIAELPSTYARKELSATDWKTHTLVVLSYMLIGFGIALACASVYMATIVHPIVAWGVPAIPIALGILLRNWADPRAGVVDQLAAAPYLPGQPPGLHNALNDCWLNAATQVAFNAYRKTLESEAKKNFLSAKIQAWLPSFGLYPLVRAFKNYTAESDDKKVVSSVNSQRLREWLYDSTYQKNLPDDMQPIHSRTSSVQDDPAGFFRHFLTITGHTLPDVRKTIERTRNGKIKTSRETVKESDPYLSLHVPERGSTTLGSLLGDFFVTNSQSGDEKIRMTKQFKKAPDDMLIELFRGYKSYERGKLVHSQKRDTYVDCPLTFNASKDQFGSNATYELNAAVLHDGTLDGGHYVALIKRGEKWWLANDRLVTLVTNPRAHLSKAVFVHYAKH